MCKLKAEFFVTFTSKYCLFEKTKLYLNLKYQCRLTKFILLETQKTIDPFQVLVTSWGVSTDDLDEITVQIHLKVSVIKSHADFFCLPLKLRLNKATTAESKHRLSKRSKVMGSSTYVRVLFDRHIELLLQLNHGPNSFGKLLHVPPIEHAAVQRVVVHVLAYPADFLGHRGRRGESEVLIRAIYMRSTQGTQVSHFSTVSVSQVDDSLSPELQEALSGTTDRQAARQAGRKTVIAFCTTMQNLTAECVAIRHPPLVTISLFLSLHHTVQHGSSFLPANNAKQSKKLKL